MKKCFKFLVSLVIILNLATDMACSTMEVPNENKETIQEVDRLQKIKEKNVLTILATDTEPYFYRNPRTGGIAGIDAEILTEVAKRLGVKEINVRYIAFSNVLEELVKNPDIDLLGQGIYITDERKNMMNFTNSIYNENEAILTLKDSKINGKGDLKDAVIGVNGGSVYVPMVEKWKQQGILKDYMPFFNNNSLIAALENRIIGAILTDSIIAENILLSKSKSNLKLLSPNQYKPEIDFSVGYPLRKEDTTLLNAVNEKLQEMKNDGTIYGILARYGLLSHYNQ